MSSVTAVTMDDLALPLEQHLLRVVAALEAYGHLVALVPPEPDQPARRRMHVLRAALESDRVAIVPVDLPPLAEALLAEQLRQLAATGLGPGVLAGAARLLSHYLHAGALLGSVGRLDRVPVPVGAQLKSLVPGRNFAVFAHPKPRVAAVDGDPESIPPGPGYLTQLAFASGSGGSPAPAWVTGPLARAWRSQRVRQVALPSDSARWWGTGRLVEFAAHIADVGVLYQLVTSVRRDRCSWCGLDVIGEKCLFCAARIDVADGRVGDHTAGGGHRRPAGPRTADDPAGAPVEARPPTRSPNETDRAPSP